MKPIDIKVGKTYCNRGKGRTHRTVLEIGIDVPIHQCFEPRPGEMVVRYSKCGKEESLYISSFAAWCGYEVLLVPREYMD